MIPEREHTEADHRRAVLGHALAAIDNAFSDIEKLIIKAETDEERDEVAEALRKAFSVKRLNKPFLKPAAKDRNKAKAARRMRRR